MPSWARTKEIWLHRHSKYGHLIDRHWWATLDLLRLRQLKLTLGKRPLVAIILSEQMGDIIACEPVAREVRRRHPDGHILWFVRRPYIELVAHHPDLDGYLIELCPGHREQLIYSGVFDHIYNLHLSHRKCKYCPDDPVNPNAERIGMHFDNYYDRGDLLYAFSQVAGLPPMTDDPKMYIPESVRERVDALPVPMAPDGSGPIVIHCQSSYAPRDWPASHWHELVTWLLETHPYPVVEVGINPVVTLEHPRFRSFCGQLSLLETAEVIQRAHLFIGIDSGPAHMANAVGTQGVILLGRLFNFVNYLPYSGRYKRGEGVSILNNFDHPCAELPYSWVQRAVQQRLGQPKLV
ncbi:glycosyl transferase [Fibrisoma montanum]|uniref:Glycosyl transferase n=1 Tax=Fibrisoma montanum TaxID=2305895 RepID=A0A418M651_9BACT|nr:glycosyltransferase family 9 protein [Fibrisoma montanum]RIV21235.1 glycosyl transferase [Fibrisoma montanum]